MAPISPMPVLSRAKSVFGAPKARWREKLYRRGVQVIATAHPRSESSIGSDDLERCNAVGAHYARRHSAAYRPARGVVSNFPTRSRQ